jgi:hypothetical protein
LTDAYHQHNLFFTVLIEKSKIEVGLFIQNNWIKDFFYYDKFISDYEQSINNFVVNYLRIIFKWLTRDINRACTFNWWSVHVNPILIKNFTEEMSIKHALLIDDPFMS